MHIPKWLIATAGVLCVVLIAALRDGLKRNDTNTLTSVGASAQSIKSRADHLAAAEKALRARFSL